MHAQAKNMLCVNKNETNKTKHGNLNTLQIHKPHKTQSSIQNYQTNMSVVEVIIFSHVGERRGLERGHLESPTSCLV
jgi:hypothetical protein